MKQRVISALWLVPLALFVYRGGISLAVAAFCIGSLSLYEFADGLARVDIRVSKPIIWTAISILYIIVSHRLLIDGDMQRCFGGILLWLFAVAFASFALPVFDRTRGVTSAPATLFAVVYAGFFSVHAVLLEQHPQGSILIWTALIAAFCTDIFAFLIGVRFGKTKLCPDVSPKKTVEGALGGLAGSLAACGLFAAFFAPDLLFHHLVIGGFGSLFAQAGDLTASAWKRGLGVKDFGTLIPGHGGMLDRFDSVLVTLPAVYYYAVLFIPS